MHNLSQSEIEAVRAKYGMSAAVEQLSLGRSNASGMTSAPGSAVPTVQPPAQGFKEHEPARTIRKAKARRSGVEGHRAFVQELENADHQEPTREAPAAPDVDHETGVSGIDGADHGVFQITIALRYPDRLRRDPHGAAETILDCLVRARRRLLDPNYRPSDRVRSGRGKSRRDNHSPKTVRKWVPF